MNPANVNKLVPLISDIALISSISLLTLEYHSLLLHNYSSPIYNPQTTFNS